MPFDLAEFCASPDNYPWALSVHLFVNSPDLSVPVDQHSFTEPAFAGYFAFAGVAVWDKIQAPTPDNAYLQSRLLTWVNSGSTPAPEIIGWYVLAKKGSDTQLVAFEEWPKPADMTGPTKGIDVVVIISSVSEDLI